MEKKNLFKRGKYIIYTLVGLIVISLILSCVTLVILSPGKTEQYTDSNGNILENSISEKVFVDINGVKQGMIIKGKNKDNPVLLFVHGGPGMPEYFLDQDYPTGMDEYFTVVWWDQRGSGLSFNEDVDKETLTTDQLIDDTISVTNYLRDRFKQEKIYIMAHSWGSYLGIQTIQRKPELYNAYIGVGQMTNQEESEEKAREYMIDYYAEKGDYSKSEKIKNLEYNSEKYKRIRDGIMHECGIGTTRNMNSVVTGIFFRSLANKEYTVSEKINLWRGKIFSSDTKMKKEKKDTDLREKVTRVDIPVYFFSGKYDYTVNYKMSEDYLNAIEAPEKEFYLFENSAHSPIFEEQEKVAEIIKNDIIKKLEL